MENPFRLGDSSSSSELPKIGPGLGSRSTFWAKVRNRIIHENKCVADPVENEMLIALASDKRWLSMVPPEWIEIYGALYDESKYFIISEHERTKIDKDIGRTFSLFERNARLLRLQFKVNMTGYSTALQNVLMAASHERGYCQGINFVAAVFLLYQASEKEAFTLLCYLLKQRFMEILYNPKCSSLLEYMNYFEKRLRKHNKRIYKYFKHIDYSPVCYSIEWFTTCFIVTCPGELSSCVLDLILVGFDDIMIRVGLAMLDHLEDQLLKLDLETMQLEFKPLASKADPYDVMFRALTIPVPSNTRQNVLKTMAQNIEVMNPRQEFVNTLRVAKAEEESQIPTPLKEERPLVIKAVERRTKKKGKKGKREKSGVKSKGQQVRRGDEQSPLSPELMGYSHSTDEAADDEGANTGFRGPESAPSTIRSGAGEKSPTNGVSGAKHAIRYHSPSKPPQPPRESISPVTPLTKDSKQFARTPSNNRRGLLIISNPQQALRNELQNIEKRRQEVFGGGGAKSQQAATAGGGGGGGEAGVVSAIIAPLPKTSTRLRKQSRPETRFSRQFIKRIPTRQKTTLIAPHIAAELNDFHDIFVVNKEVVRKSSGASSPRRTPGISSTPTNGGISTTPAVSGTSSVPVKATASDKQPSLLKAQISTRKVNNPRMLQDSHSPLNVELHEKMEARLMHHLFPPAPPKKGSSSSGGGGGVGGGAVGSTSAAGTAPPAANKGNAMKGPPVGKSGGVVTGQFSTASSAASSPQKPSPSQPAPAASQKQQQAAQQSGSGAQWFDKVVSDTLWFTTFGLVHAPVPPVQPAAPKPSAAVPASAPAPASRPVKESSEPPWVVKKELQQHQQLSHQQKSRSQRDLEEMQDVLVWIPGTQEGYDADVSQDDSDGEEIMLPATGQPQSRTKRRANHIRSTSVGNRSKMVSIDIHGRSNIVEDLENPIDLLANVEERWFSVASENNPSYKLLNKQYHNLVNLAIRRKRNKRRNFKEKL